MRYQDQIFSGPGGLHAHGRWTYRDQPVVYTSHSIALAVLERPVNYRRRGWADPDPPSTLREIGHAWLQRGATAVMKVPSAIVTEEWNYLLNPGHPDFKKLTIGKPVRYLFDRRLARVRKS